MKQYKYHPLANIFPMLEGPELQALADSIKIDGQQEPIILAYHQDFDAGETESTEKILDGRNRYQACIIAGVEPIYRHFAQMLTEDEQYKHLDSIHWPTPAQFVIARNLHRRHLSDSQRAAIAADLVNSKIGAPKKSQAEEHADHLEGTSAPAPVEQITQADAATMLNVSPANVARAVEVKKKGSKKLHAAVRAGKIGVAPAATLAKSTSHKGQDKLLDRTPKEIQKSIVKLTKFRNKKSTAAADKTKAGKDIAALEKQLAKLKAEKGETSAAPRGGLAAEKREQDAKDAAMADGGFIARVNQILDDEFTAAKTAQGTVALDAIPAMERLIDKCKAAIAKL